MMALAALVAGTGLFWLFPTADSTQSLETFSTPAPVNATPLVQTAEEAAIEFVYSGAAAMPMTLDDVAVGDLTAVVMSRSGDLVLVEVTQKNSAEMTKIATLLLQKTEATWRIREVFDSQEY